MRKFIISDIHGNGNIYYSIMNYLDNLNQKEDIILYINGDLIDRGYDSAEILLDIKKRIESNTFQIEYLGGNHELLMYQEFENRKQGINSYYNDWYDNGGSITDDRLNEILDYDKDKILKVVDFISNLKIYHKFSECINGKNIVLVHAACPINIKDECDLIIKDNNDKVELSTWTRENDPFIPFRCRIGDDNYFTIVGHTPNNNPYGYEYHINGNYLNIDGGCVRYVCGYFEYNHVPLVEINEGYLKILTFNNNNEIIYGNTFDGNKSIPISEEELNNDRKLLNKEIKIKKLIKNEDGAVYYK